MDPSFRTLRQVTIDSLPEADRVFSMLMGDEVPPRENLLRKTLFTQILMPNWAYKNQLTNQKHIYKDESYYCRSRKCRSNLCRRNFL
jgi:hypothetical protein